MRKRRRQRAEDVRALVAVIDQQLRQHGAYPFFRTVQYPAFRGDRALSAIVVEHLPRRYGLSDGTDVAALELLRDELTRLYGGGDPAGNLRALKYLIADARAFQAAPAVPPPGQQLQLFQEDSHAMSLRRRRQGGRRIPR